MYFGWQLLTGKQRTKTRNLKQKTANFGWRGFPRSGGAISDPLILLISGSESAAPAVPV